MQLRTINDPRERGHLTGCNVELPESSEISAHHVKCSLQCKWTLCRTGDACPIDIACGLYTVQSE